MFFLKLLTNKDVIHINFHSPQALPTLHLLLADFMGTFVPRQEWQTEHPPHLVVHSAWQCLGAADHCTPHFWAEWMPQTPWPRLVYEWQLFYLVLGRRGLPIVAQVLVDWAFSDREPPCCLLPMVISEKSGKAPFYPCQALPGFVGHPHSLEKHTSWLTGVLDLCSLVQWATGFAWRSSHSYFCCFPQ